jgi:hypothetical protein
MRREGERQKERKRGDKREIDTETERKHTRTHTHTHTHTRTSLVDLVSSQRPKTELAAARTEVRELRVVVMPALATEMVCCSIASWMATRSCSRIWHVQAAKGRERKRKKRE